MISYIGTLFNVLFIHVQDSGLFRNMFHCINIDLFFVCFRKWIGVSLV